MLAKAEYPLIVTAALGRSPEAVAALADLAAGFAIPVVQPFATDLNLPTDHPMHLGFETGAASRAGRRRSSSSMRRAVDAADGEAEGDAKVIHMSVDPLVSRHPFREYEADLLVAGDPVAGLKMLRQALAGTRRPRTARSIPAARRSPPRATTCSPSATSWRSR